MKHSSRLFYCSFCLQQVVICSYCDRGNIYCGPKCALTARKQYCKASNKRYQKTTKGRFNNALRQKRFRAHQKNKVTDHGSHNIYQNALLIKAKNNATSNVIKQKMSEFTCCFCNKTGFYWLRHDFLRYDAKNIKKLRYSMPP